MTKTEQQLDDELRLELWVKRNKGNHGRNVHLLEAVEIFKDDLYRVCMDKLSAGEDEVNIKKALFTLRDDRRGKLNIQKAKETSIVALTQRFGFVARLGFIKCPFHEDRSASLKLYPKTERWWCFGCNSGTSTIDFVMKMQKCDFVAAVKYLT